MRLNLKYPPTPENAPKFAEDIVTATAEIDGVALTWVPISISEVDSILEDMRREGLTSDQVGETVFSFGCYLGEILVRNADGRWRDRHETPLAEHGDMPIVVELPHGTACDPIGRAFKRLWNGSVDSLLHFYKVFTEPPSPK